MKIYLASSWRNLQQPIVLDLLRAAGHDVYDFKNPEHNNFGFHWREISPDYKHWDFKAYKEALSHKVSRIGFHHDFEAMHRSDVCVLLLPCGASAHIEAGWMSGQGKPTYILIPEFKGNPELMYLLATDIFESTGDLLEALSNLK